MLVLLVIAELYLALYTRECASLLLGHRMRTVQDRVPGLDVQKRQLHGIPAVDVLIGEEVLSSQENSFRLVYTLFAESFARVDPIH